MIIRLSKRKLKKVFVCLFILSILFIGFQFFPTQRGVTVLATSTDDLNKQLEDLQKELAAIQKQKQDIDAKIAAEKNVQGSLTSQIKSLSNSIASLELSIQEKETDIELKQTEIKILEEESTETSQQILKIEKNIDQLDETANDIIRSLYIESKTNSTIDILLSSNEGVSFFSQIQYHTAIGTKEENTLGTLSTQKEELKTEKDKIETSKIEVEKLAEQILHEKEALEKDQEQLTAQKNQKNKLLQDSKTAASYYNEQYDNLTEDEKKKEAEIDYVMQQVASSATKPKGYVYKDKIIATEGSNGCSTGPHTHFGMAIGKDNWVNPCDYLSSNQFGWGNCSGNSTIQYPYKSPFYSSRGYSWYHKALDLYAGSNKYVYAAHDGWFFEEAPACSNSWCSVGCKSATNPCVKICENEDCKTGKITIYCHVNFL